MGEKHILIANPDLRLLGEHGRALGQQWKVTLVTDSTEAMTALALNPFEVVVADAALPGVSGVELLDHIHSQYPKTIRILVASEADLGHRIVDVQGTNLILPKPCDAVTIKNAVERSLAINLWLASDSLRELVGRLRTFPIIPSLYLEVVNALKSPHASTEEIGAIIAKDMAMMTKLLRVTNSACFGLPRKISDPVEAVGILGFETVKMMVMTLKLLSQYDKVKPVYFSIDRLWRHSTQVARLARDVARCESDDATLAESAFAAGLMHDVGKLILAANFDKQYNGAQDLARNEQIPLVDAEKKVFGATHGEIGAYLLGIWGMPLELVEAAALHHQPSQSQAKCLGPLALVHVANALAYEINPDKEGFLPSQIDEAYLAELGLSARLKFWRETVVPQETNSTEFRTQSTQTTIFRKAPASTSKAPADPVEAAPSSERFALSWFASPQKWFYGGLAVVALVMFFWLGTQALIQRALEPTVEPARLAAVASPSVVPESFNKTTPPAAPEPPPAAKPAEPPAVAPATVASADPAPVPKQAAIDQVLEALQLQSIFFSAAHPTAVISGQAVHPNDSLRDGTTVVSISPSSVVLELDNERRTLYLR
jgi:HD-like signal output (HDOD) protein/ActR/RegA family two-component response regulator